MLQHSSAISAMNLLFLLASCCAAAGQLFGKAHHSNEPIFPAVRRAGHQVRASFTPTQGLSQFSMTQLSWFTCMLSCYSHDYTTSRLEIGRDGDLRKHFVSCSGDSRGTSEPKVGSRSLTRTINENTRSAKHDLRI